MKTIVEMAKQVLDEGYAPVLLHPEIQRLCELVRDDEKEACAKVVDAIEAQCITDDVDDPPLAHVAAAIRARGQHD